MSIYLFLPFPPKALDRNHGTDNRNAKARAVATYKESCRMWAWSERNRLGITEPLQAPVLAEIVFVVRNMRRDVDNCLAAFKAGLDGIVASGLIKDDNAKALIIVPSVIQGAREEVRVRLTSHTGIVAVTQ